MLNLDCRCIDSDPYSEVFAPSNSAFAAYLSETGLTAEELLASPVLKKILANHVIQGKLSAADVLAMDLPVDVATLGGAVLKIEKAADGSVIVGGQRVDRPDIMAANGVIHGLSGVITETSGISFLPIVETLTAEPDYSTLLAAVVAADLATDLSAEGLTAGPPPSIISKDVHPRFLRSALRMSKQSAHFIVARRLRLERCQRLPNPKPYTLC